MTKMALDAPYDCIRIFFSFFLLILITEQQFLFFLLRSVKDKLFPTMHFFWFVMRFWCITLTNHGGMCSRLFCGRTLPASRARAAMPFGCLTLGEKKDYNNPSEVTDKYDLGQIVKSWVHPCCGADKSRKTQISLPPSSLLFVFSTERSFVRYSGRRIGTLWECTPVKSSIRRTGGKWGKLPRMRSWS